MGKQHNRSAHAWQKLFAWVRPPCAASRQSREEVVRIRPTELCAQMSLGQGIVVLDLRHPLDALGDSRAIPGSTRVRPQDLAWGKLDFAPDDILVTYCAMEEEAASEHAARLLKRRGFRNVRVLAGGFSAWRDEGLPLMEYRNWDRDRSREQHSACRSPASGERPSATARSAR
jgi:rhodanese-related sulfurtransferase